MRFDLIRFDSIRVRTCACARTHTLTDTHFVRCPATTGKGKQLEREISAGGRDTLPQRRTCAAARAAGTGVTPRSVSRKTLSTPVRVGGHRVTIHAVGTRTSTCAHAGMHGSTCRRARTSHKKHCPHYGGHGIRCHRGRGRGAPVVLSRREAAGARWSGLKMPTPHQRTSRTRRICKTEHTRTEELVKAGAARRAPRRRGWGFRRLRRRTKNDSLLQQPCNQLHMHSEGPCGPAERNAVAGTSAAARCSALKHRSGVIHWSTQRNPPYKYPRRIKIVCSVEQDLLHRA